jgi:hypothetical protein
MDCIAIGNDVAVEIGRAMKCEADVRIRRDLAIISPGHGTINDLRRLRASVKAKRVVWIVPYDRAAAETVYRAGAERRDGFVDLQLFPTRDGRKPRSNGDVIRYMLHPDPVRAYGAP